MEQYTELQQYAMDYVTERKKHITKQIEELDKEAAAPDILYSKHEELMAKKAKLIKAFDELTTEYRSIVNVSKVYDYYQAKEEEFRKKKEALAIKWGLPNEKK